MFCVSKTFSDASNIPFHVSTQIFYVSKILSDASKTIFYV